jgi:hypothetical protein
MIRALLLGAFATTAYGACTADLSAATCKNFAEQADFNIANNAADSTQIDMTYVTAINAAYSYIGQGPWSTSGAKTTTGTDAFPNQPSGVVFTNQGSTPAIGEVTCVKTAPLGGDPAVAATTNNAFPFGCPSSSGVTGTACQDNTIVMTGTIGAMVGQLDTNGDYTLYFQRVNVNPITGNNIALNWIAENACKLRVEVTFQCSGSECVEVTTIVCATFAGILETSFGQVSTECKIPTSFQVSDDGGTNTASVNIRHSDAAYTDPSSPTGGTWNDDVNGCSPTNGRCFFQHNSQAAIADGSSLVGGISYTAWVQGPATGTANTQINGRWSVAEELLHQAKYNLTVASALPKTFDMDVNVKFHSTDANAGTIKNTIDTIKTVTGFNAATAAGPFLARSKVEMGSIVDHQHAYLQVVAKVAAPQSWFKDLKLTKVVHTTPSATVTDSVIGMVDPTTSTAPAAGECKIAEPIAPTDNVVASTEMGTVGTSALVHWHADGNDMWPMAFIYCPEFMSTGFTDDTSSAAGGAVTAGDTLVISLSWKLAKQTTSSGKAQLLQEADAPGQNVEVSLTIQLGGGETTITTAGAGADGSADNTVTYIIIAVCVIAAALILAVVVVAFMCLRNRSQEQLVAMSPQKATVAAVYDISQPKAKADAMDV